MTTPAVKPVEDIIEEQKQLAVDLLNRFGAYANTLQDVLVMGGAPRDWDNNKEAKDIDLFIRVPPEVLEKGAVEGLLCEIFNVDISQLKDTVEEREVDKYRNSFIKWVYNLVGFAYPVQLIGIIDKPVNYCAQFPVSISKIGFNNKGEFVKSLSYKVSSAFNTVYFKWPTMDNQWQYPPMTEERMKKDQAYITKVLAKYPDRIEQDMNEYQKHLQTYLEHAKDDDRTIWRWI